VARSPSLAPAGISDDLSGFPIGDSKPDTQCQPAGPFKPWQGLHKGQQARKHCITTQSCTVRLHRKAAESCSVFPSIPACVAGQHHYVRNSYPLVPERSFPLVFPREQSPGGFTSARSLPRGACRPGGDRSRLPPVFGGAHWSWR